MSKLANRTALITGGGSGIGLATARLYLDEGARVVIAGRDEAKLATASKSLNGGNRLAWFGPTSRRRTWPRALSAVPPSSWGALTSW
jgi:NAD(P)-dependent dehydrogenase (short-subunit alcohol dehydrogenase family)